MSKFVKLLFCVLAFITAMYSGDAWAAGYRAVSDENYPPFMYIDAHQNLTGYDYDVIQLLRRKTGLDIDVKPVEWSLAKRMVIEGTADILLGVSRSPEREANYDFTQSFLENRVVIFVPKENFSIRRPEDLIARRVGVQYGDFAEEHLLYTYSNIHLYTYNNQVEALEDLKIGKIDAVVGNYYNGIYWLNKNNWNDYLKVVGEPLVTRPHCIAVKKGNKELLAVLDKGLTEAKESGEIKKIQDRWFGENYFLSFSPSTKHAQYLAYLFAFIVFIVVMACTFIYSLRHQVDKATEELKAANSQLSQAYEVTIHAFLKALEHRESQTAIHSIRVNRLAMAIGSELKLSREEMVQLNWGTLLHDIGKLSINDAVLLKPGMLTPEEYEKIKRHPVIGHEIFQGSAYLSGPADVILYHHEKYDGTGYPFGLRAEQIPLVARICAVADAFEAIIADRPYRKGRPISEALAELVRCSGTQFDPRVVEVFIVLAARNDFSDLLNNGKQG